jgi:hypothetical protein
MEKRIMIIAIMTLTALAAVAFAGCNGFNLTEYKANGRAAIQTYADAKITENAYSDANLQAIATAVNTGKAAVDAAENKTAVNDAVKYDSIFIPEHILEGVSFYNYTHMYLSIWHNV